MFILFCIIMAIGLICDMTTLVVIGAIGAVLTLFLMASIWYLSDVFRLRKHS